MKKIIAILCLLLCLCACKQTEQPSQVAVTTLPAYEFTTRLCAGTDIRVTQLVTESISCLHDYTLQVGQMRAIEAAQITVISGAGLEEFLTDALTSCSQIIDSSEGIAFIHTQHDHHSEHEQDHSHHDDPHYWLSPANAVIMAENICLGLMDVFPQYTNVFQRNFAEVKNELDALQIYGQTALRDLSCRELVTFHDGFSYFADAFDLTIVKAIEEESGSEASAAELIELINIVNEHNLPAIFTERNGSDAAASVISEETGVRVYALDMAIAGSSYFDAMYRNIDTIKEALG